MPINLTKIKHKVWAEQVKYKYLLNAFLHYICRSLLLLLLFVTF